MEYPDLKPPLILKIRLKIEISVLRSLKWEQLHLIIEILLFSWFREHIISWLILADNFREVAKRMALAARSSGNPDPGGVPITDVIKDLDQFFHLKLIFC